MLHNKCLHEHFKNLVLYIYKYLFPSDIHVYQNKGTPLVIDGAV
jgi:hypothetical protein